MMPTKVAGCCVITKDVNESAMMMAKYLPRLPVSILTAMVNMVADLLSVA